MYCRKCDTPMATTGESFGETPKYVCPNSREGCDTPEIPAVPFNQIVFERVIRAALEGESTKRVAGIVQEDAQQRIKEYQDAQSSVAQNLPGLNPAMQRLLQLPPGEYIEPLRRLDRYWTSTGDTRHIEEYALGLDTYLRPNNISTTRTIMDTAVADIQVGRGSATITYNTPMPPGSGAEGRTQEEVDLPS